MGIERYGHGGDLQTANELYGRPEGGWLDYSSNMNPWGPPERAGFALFEGWGTIDRYPDPAVRRLRYKLAARYGIDPDAILAGNGAAELIDLVTRWCSPKLTAVSKPSFSEYTEAAVKAGSRIMELPLHEQEDFRLTDPELYVRTAGREGAIILGHPNNPTGKLLQASAVEHLLQERGTDSTLILDEAFIDFIPDEQGRSFIQQAASSKRFIVIRSMTKFYAIPGIRLGFLVTHPDTVRQLLALQTRWSVNSLAQAIGEAVLDERAYAERTIRWLQEERPRYSEALSALGLRVYDSDVNFVLACLPECWSMTSRQLQHAMAQRGLLIRDASRFSGLNDRYIRLAVKLKHQNDLLIAAMKESIAEHRKGEGGTL